MDINIVTQSDILQMKNEIISHLTDALSKASNPGKRYMKSSEVAEMLGISASSLQNLRIAGVIPFSKLGGTLFYDYEEIQSVIEKNKKNIA